VPLQKSTYRDIYYPTLRTIREVRHFRSCLAISNDRRFAIFECRMLKNRVCLCLVAWGTYMYDVTLLISSLKIFDTQTTCAVNLSNAIKL